MSPQRPARDEYDAFYETYVSKVPEGNVLDLLHQQTTRALALFESISPELENFRYAEGKWSTKEVIGHLVDTEWVFTTRALRIARGDTTPLPGVDQDVLIAGADFDQRPLASLIEEFRHLRGANSTLFRSLSPEAVARRGTASDCPISVRGLLYIVVGHVEHHLGVLRERYLS